MMMKNIFIFVLFSITISVKCNNAYNNDDKSNSIWNSGSQFIQPLEEIEGSGEEVISFPAQTTTSKPNSKESSIKGIPNVFFKLPKAPAFKTPSQREYRRKQATKAEYSSSSLQRQTFVESMLDFLGFKTPKSSTAPQLEESLMDILYDKSRKNHVNPLRTVQSTMKMNPTTYQCENGIEASQVFNITKFMGQWYQVMYTSSNNNVNNCRMMSYRLLNLVDIDHYVGSTFETLEYTNDESSSTPQMSSGFGMVNQPGELYYRSSRGNLNVNIIHVGPENQSGFYQYVILAVDCYYPIHVFARDPMVFQQYYENEVQQVMRNKQLINDFSRALNFVKNVDFTTCLLPPSFFTGK